MAGSKLNVVGSESSYSQSQDFLNIDEPPAAKETPDVSEYDLSVSRPSGIPGSSYNNYNYNYTGGTRYGSGFTAGSSLLSHGGPRRRSTNYMDALNQKLGERAKAAKDELPDFARRKSTSPGMDFQDTRHDVEIKSVKGEIDKNSDASMGDSLQEKKKTAPPLFKDSYMREDGTKPCSVNSTNADYYRSSFSSKGNEVPGLERRKSSFAYEDYKKGVYDKMNMFNRN